MPAYFNLYNYFVSKSDTTYNLRRIPLPVPAFNYMCAESLVIYRLGKLKNTMSVKFPFVAKHTNEKSHSLAGFMFCNVDMADMIIYAQQGRKSMFKHGGG